MPIEITDWNELDAVRQDLDEEYVLLNDLDETTDGYDDHASETANGGDGWEPIGDNDNDFEGTFDGQGYEINDLYIDRPNTDYVGLFGYTGSTGVVENVGLIDVDITGDNQVGGLVGWNGGDVSGSYSTGDVTGDERVGGLIGRNIYKPGKQYIVCINGDVKEIVDYETIEGRYTPSLCWVEVSEEHLNGLDENWHKKIDKLKLVDGEIKLDNG